MGGRDLKRFGPSVVGGPWRVAGRGRQGLASGLGWLRGDGSVIREFRFVGNFDVYRRDSRKELGDRLRLGPIPSYLESRILGERVATGHQG